MDDILDKIIVNKKEKRDVVFDRIELELNLKIEIEKTKQLELIKDIRKIEKSIKEKELYCKRSTNISLYNSSNDSSDESCSDDDCSISTDSDSDDDNLNEDDIKYNNDSISLCSVDSECDVDNEVEIL